MVILITSDNKQFVVEKDVFARSGVLKGTKRISAGPSLSHASFSPSDFGESDEPVPLHKVSSDVLEKILEYCEHYKDEPYLDVDPDADQDGRRRRTTDIGEWDQSFINVDQEMLFELILAANYLDIRSLLDLGCKTVANLIKGKTPDEIRRIFNITNDFTPEEEAQIRQENLWAQIID